MGQQDADRPLTPSGERDAERLGAWMADEGLVPDHVVSSPAVRAVETARRVLPDREPVHDGRVYEASLPDLLAVLADLPEDAERVLLVGHNPGLEHLVRALDPSAAPPPGGEWFATCTLARLELEAPRRGGGRLLGLSRVARLP